jgi:hypothetical protein
MALFDTAETFALFERQGVGSLSNDSLKILCIMNLSRQLFHLFCWPGYSICHLSSSWQCQKPFWWNMLLNGFPRILCRNHYFFFRNPGATVEVLLLLEWNYLLLCPFHYAKSPSPRMISIANAAPQDFLPRILVYCWKILQQLVALNCHLNRL